jgi:hypothetical protein
VVDVFHADQDADLALVNDFLAKHLVDFAQQTRPYVGDAVVAHVLHVDLAAQFGITQEDFL